MESPFTITVSTNSIRVEHGTGSISSKASVSYMDLHSDRSLYSLSLSVEFCTGPSNLTLPIQSMSPPINRRLLNRRRPHQFLHLSFRVYGTGMWKVGRFASGGVSSFGEMVLDYPEISDSEMPQPVHITKRSNLSAFLKQ
jgi:hypothetical protein